MLKKLFLLLILHPCLIFASPTLISQNENEENEEEVGEINAYDPFTDYIDFQDTDSEADDMTFFQTGRVLSVGGYVGYRHFIFAPNQDRNTTNSVNYGAFIKSFANLHIAIQFSYIGSNNSFYYTNSKNTLLSARTIYHNFGAEFRYYWNRTQLVRTLARLNPYVAVGVLVTRRTSQILISVEENTIVPQSDIGGGLKGGLGLEFHISTRFYIGLHAEYNFMFIDQKSAPPINNKNEYVYPPENMLNAMFVLGRNF